MTDKPTPFPYPSHRIELVEFLSTRRSNLAKVMGGPGPDPATRDAILEIGVRVPDHRKLAPWRFVIFEGPARAEFGEHIKKAFTAQNTNLPSERYDFEAARLTRAPLVIAVISTPVECPRGTPKWEQELSSRAVCFNLCLAAQAHGFGAQWLTDWFAYDTFVNGALGLGETERVSGYIYIGTPTSQSMPRLRPKVEDLTQFWGNSG